jgi:hypothetical protein
MIDYTSDHTPRKPRRPLAILGLCLALGFGTFMWLKLRVVTNVPRSAYADPEVVAPTPARDQSGPANPAAPATPGDAVPSAPPAADPNR